MIDFGYVAKVNNKTYYVNTNIDGEGGRIVSQYNMLPTDDFTVDDVIAYLYKNPDKLVYVYPKITHTLEEKKELCRMERDTLLREATWRRERHNDEVLLGLDPTEPLLPIVEYIQALRDVPQQEGFPKDIEWPAPPWEIPEGDEE